jgi:hypothetical protein
MKTAINAALVGPRIAASGIRVDIYAIDARLGQHAVRFRKRERDTRSQREAVYGTVP